jgi:hypothetical protein
MTLAERVREILEAGGGDERAGIRFLPMVTLESETRFGLDASLGWVAVPPDDRPPFPCGAGTEHVLAEALEWKRDLFDAALEEAAGRHGLDPLEVQLAFPVAELVRGVLATRSPYLTRLALMWLRPTELRPLRTAISRVANDPELPAPVKDLAARLVVPE